jgi:hypothetical protein
MKKVFIAVAILFSLSASAQEKKDTTIEIKLSIDQYRAIMYTIDANIDSKKISKELLEFIAKNASIVADKPKEVIKK